MKAFDRLMAALRKKQWTCLCKAAFCRFGKGARLPEAIPPPGGHGKPQPLIDDGKGGHLQVQRPPPRQPHTLDDRGRRRVCPSLFDACATAPVRQNPLLRVHVPPGKANEHRTDRRTDEGGTGERRIGVFRGCQPDNGTTDGDRHLPASALRQWADNPDLQDTTVQSGSWPAVVSKI